MEMREYKYKIISLGIILILFGCGAPAKYTPQDKDPLLESIEYYRQQDCLRNCADSDKWNDCD